MTIATTIAIIAFVRVDESPVHLFVSGVIVARRGCVFDFSVIGHPISPDAFPAPADLA